MKINQTDSDVDNLEPDHLTATVGEFNVALWRTAYETHIMPTVAGIQNASSKSRAEPGIVTATASTLFGDALVVLFLPNGKGNVQLNNGTIHKKADYITQWINGATGDNSLGKKCFNSAQLSHLVGSAVALGKFNEFKIDGVTQYGQLALAPGDCFGCRVELKDKDRDVSINVNYYLQQTGEIGSSTSGSTFNTSAVYQALASVPDFGAGITALTTPTFSMDDQTADLNNSNANFIVSSSSVPAADGEYYNAYKAFTLTVHPWVSALDTYSVYTGSALAEKDSFAPVENGPGIPGSWLKVALPESLGVANFALSANYEGDASMPSSMTLYYSTDNSNYIVAHTVADAKLSSGWNIFTLPNVRVARYFVLHVTKTNGPSVNLYVNDMKFNHGVPTTTTIPPLITPLLTSATQYHTEPFAVMSSSYLNDDNKPHMAFNGQPTQPWVTAANTYTAATGFPTAGQDKFLDKGAGSWIKVQTFDISKVTTFHAKGEWLANHLSLYVSMDNLIFTKVHTVTVDGSRDEATTVVLAQPVHGRYFVLHVTKVKLGETTFLMPALSFNA